MVQTWLVTGASSGAGKAVTLEVLSQGGNVIAAVRNPSSISDLSSQFPKQLVVVKCDVTIQEDVDAAFAAAKDAFGRIDAVWNNAGYSVVAEIEAAPIEEAKALFDTNVWGAVRVSTAAIKFFREVNKPVGGRLLQASSLQGIRADAGFGVYSASKWALESISESMNAELDPAWNIKVIIAQMGSYRTNFANAFKTFTHPAYESNPNLASTQNRTFLATLPPDGLKGDPAKLAKKLVEASLLENPPLRLLLGEEVPMYAQAKWDKDAAERAKYASWSEGLNFDE